MKPFLSYSLILFGILGRLIPHPWNFTPLGACALLSGAKLGRLSMWIAPFSALLVSDFILNTYYGFGRWFLLFPFIYASFGINIFLGRFIKGKKDWLKLTSLSFLGSLQFFIITNLGVWLITPAIAKTTAGLLQAYVIAIPFFQASLIGNAIWGVVFYFVLNRVEIFWEEKESSYMQASAR